MPDFIAIERLALVTSPSVSAQKNNVSLAINGEILEGWHNVSIQRSMKSLSGQFRLDVLDRWRETHSNWPLRPGNKVEVYIGGEKLMKGYIDNLNVSFSSGQRTIEVSGRHITGDLCDCSAVIEPPQFFNQRLDQIAKTLCKPFGISVVVETDVGAAFEVCVVKQGETVFELLEKLAKIRGLLINSDEEGNLVITRRANGRAKCSIVQGVNLLSGSATYDNTNRFSKYIIKGSSKGTDEAYGENATEVLGIGIDKGVDRYRPLIVIAETSINDDLAKRRAAWETITRAGNSAAIKLTVVDWYQASGVLWDINQTVHVTAPFLGLDSDLLIVSNHFQKGAQGTTTELELVRPDAYYPNGSLSADFDPIDTLGEE